jgi:hypothetical protein
MTIKEIKKACIHYKAVAMTSNGSVKQNAVRQYKYYRDLLSTYSVLTNK